jgi:hypothetical protein
MQASADTHRYTNTRTCVCVCVCLCVFNEVIASVSRDAAGHMLRLSDSVCVSSV